MPLIVMHPIVKPSASDKPGRTNVIVCSSLAPLVSSPPQVIGRLSSEAGTFSPIFSMWGRMSSPVFNFCFASGPITL